MRAAGIFILIITSSFFSKSGFSQQSEESVIRDLESLEVAAILKKDTSALRLLMSPDIVVHNPENSIVGFREIISRIAEGKINYKIFDRAIEKVTFFTITAVVMGKETLIPQGATLNAGKTIIRRFTNVWIKENKIWRLYARQSTIISINDNQ